MPTKTVSLTDEVWEIMREVPKGEQSRYVNEAIRMVHYGASERAHHQVQMRLTEIDLGLKSCFGKNGRYNREFFWEFMEHKYLKVPKGKSLEKFLKGWLGR